MGKGIERKRDAIGGGQRQGQHRDSRAGKKGADWPRKDGEALDKGALQKKERHRRRIGGKQGGKRSKRKEGGG